MKHLLLLVGVERGAVTFSNYLRDVYDLGDYRLQYPRNW